MIFLIQLMKVIFGRFLLLGIGGSIRVCSDGLILGTMLAQKGRKVLKVHRESLVHKVQQVQPDPMGLMVVLLLAQQQM